MGTRSGNPLWKNNKSGGTPISAEALNNIDNALDTTVTTDDLDTLETSLKATIGRLASDGVLS